MIIDYWHYGYPRWISLPAFLSHEFVEYAGRFASMVASRYPEVSHHLPCNEARVGADQIDSGVWRPYLRHRRRRSVRPDGESLDPNGAPDQESESQRGDSDG